MRNLQQILGFFLFCTAAQAKTWPVDGIVMAMDPPAGTMLVTHRPISRNGEIYMGAMAMPFHVEDPRELAGLHPGARIEFELIVLKDRSFARNIRKSGDPDAIIPAPKEKLKTGDTLPAFQLTDQHGNRVGLADLRGKVLAINFIYTRCPLPDVCPRLSTSFALLQKRLRSHMGNDLLLLSITVDPDYDTPPVLADYARRWGAVSPGWRFLTGDVSKIAALLGEVYWADEGSIGHNSTTTVVDRNGKLAATVEGSSWRADQLEKLIAYQLEKNP
jgi:protein SCO1/2